MELRRFHHECVRHSRAGDTNGLRRNHKFLSRVFQVPETPPELQHDDEFYLAIKPARGLLSTFVSGGLRLVAGFIFSSWARGD